MNNTSVVAFACTLAAGLLAGCDSEPEFDEVESVEIDDSEAVSELISSIDVDESVIEFHQLEDGTIVVSELGPSDADSNLTFFSVEHEATPLEIFTALAPDREAPEVLQIQHDEVSQDPPRDLSRDDITFRGTLGWKYATSCAYANDGPWFDALADSYGWNWKWYLSTNFTSSLSSHSRSTPSVKRKSHVSHVCNYSVDRDGAAYSGMLHALFNDQAVGAQWSQTGIQPGFRSVTYSSTPTRVQWHALAGSNHYGARGNYKIGVMAP